MCFRPFLPCNTEFVLSTAITGFSYLQSSFIICPAQPVVPSAPWLLSAPCPHPKGVPADTRVCYSSHSWPTGCFWSSHIRLLNTHWQPYHALSFSIFDFSHRSVMHTKKFHSRAAGLEWIPTLIGTSLLSKYSAAIGPNSAPSVAQWYLINRCLYVSILILGLSASFFSFFLLFCFVF